MMVYDLTPTERTYMALSWFALAVLLGEVQ